NLRCSVAPVYLSLTLEAFVSLSICALKKG
ncbi:MAG: hypothetical protein ACI9S8_003213, partial [Chlamydiales bacterium]